MKNIAKGPRGKTSSMNKLQYNEEKNNKNLSSGDIKSFSQNIGHKSRVGEEKSQLPKRGVVNLKGPHVSCWHNKNLVRSELVVMG